MRVSLFSLSNFPSSYYSDLDLDNLNLFFKTISKNISNLCNDNGNFYQIIFGFFNLHQKTGGITFNMDLIKKFILEDNKNVHYELMELSELVSVPLYLSVLFQNSKEEFISFFETNILENLTPYIKDLQTTEISQLVVMISNFEYKK